MKWNERQRNIITKRRDNKNVRKCRKSDDETTKTLENVGNQMKTMKIKISNRFVKKQ